MGNPTNTAIVQQSIGVGLCYHPIHKTQGIYPYPTTGIVITGFPRKTVGSINITTTTMLVRSTCGHIGTLVTGSSDITSGNISQCKVGSHFTGDFVGEIVTGGAKHLSG